MTLLLDRDNLILQSLSQILKGQGWPRNENNILSVSSIQLLSRVRLCDPVDCSTRLRCPSPAPGACSDSCPSSWYGHATVSSSHLVYSYLNIWFTFFLLFKIERAQYWLEHHSSHFFCQDTQANEGDLLGNLLNWRLQKDDSCKTVLHCYKQLNWIHEERGILTNLVVNKAKGSEIHRKIISEKIQRDHRNIIISRSLRYKETLSFQGV